MFAVCTPDMRGAKDIKDAKQGTARIALQGKGFQLCGEGVKASNLPNGGCTASQCNPRMLNQAWLRRILGTLSKRTQRRGEAGRGQVNDGHRAVR
jgi:hypothetical protein